MEIMNFVLPVTSLLVAAIARAQYHIDCFVEGQCTNSLLLDYTSKDSAQECLEFCQSTLTCKAFTFYSGSQSCLVFEYCWEFEYSCDNCRSGHSACQDLRYMLKNIYHCISV